MSPRTHPRQRRGRAVERPSHIDHLCVPPGVGVYLAQRTGGTGNPGVVDQEIKRSHLLLHGGDGALRIAALSDVGGDRHGVSAVLLDEPHRLDKISGRARAHADRCPVGGQRQRDGAAQAATPSRHQSDLSLEIPGHTTLGHSCTSCSCGSHDTGTLTLLPAVYQEPPPVVHVPRRLRSVCLLAACRVEPNTRDRAPLCAVSEASRVHAVITVARPVGCRVACGVDHLRQVAVGQA